MNANDDVVFKICGRSEWEEATRTGTYGGSADDARDGFIHFSRASQLEATAAKHFAAREDLVLVVVDASRLGAALRYERSRGGALFPHLYSALPTEAAIAVHPLPWDGSRHRFPPGIPVGS